MVYYVFVQFMNLLYVYELGVVFSNFQPGKKNNLFT